MTDEEELINMLRILLGSCYRVKAHNKDWDYSKSEYFYFERNMEWANDLLKKYGEEL